MSVLVAVTPLTRDEVERVLSAEGCRRVAEIPRRGSERAAAWAKDAGEIRFETDMLSGAGVFVSSGDDQGALAETVGRIGASETPSVILARALEEPRAGACARALLVLRFAASFKGHGIDRVELARFARRCLHAEARGLRAAAVETLLALQWPELDAAVEGLGDAHPDFAWFEGEWRRLRAQNDELTRARDAAEAARALARSLPDLLREGRFGEAFEATEVLGEDLVPSPTYWEARARSALALGAEPLRAAFAAAAWGARGGGEEATVVLRSALAATRAGEGDVAALALEMLGALRDADGERDVDAGITALEALAAEPSAWHDDLGFLFTTAILAETPAAASVERARAHLEPITKSRPSFVEGFCQLGWAAVIVGDYARGDAAYDEAIRLLSSGEQTPEAPLGLARFEHDLLEREGPWSPPTVASVLETMRFMATQREERRGAVVFLADRLLALPDELVDERRRHAAHLDRARALAALGRHAEAAESYRSALASEPSNAATHAAALRFQLARALARAGDPHEAIASLAEAVSIDPTLGVRARGDDAFAGVWDAGEFVCATVAWDASPDEDDADRLRAQAEQALARGAVSSALDTSHRAIAAAYATADPDRVARAWRTHGEALARAGAPERGAVILRTSLAIARLTGAPGEVADLAQALGSALLEAGRLDEAQEALEEALATRRDAVGPDDPRVAETLGELARLAVARGDLDEGARLLADAVALEEAFLEAGPEPERFVRTLADLAKNEAQRLALSVAQGAARGRVNEAALRSLAALSSIGDAGVDVPAETARNIRKSLAAALSQIAPDTAEEQQESEALITAAFELEEPDAELRAEKLYWLGLRASLAGLSRKGVPGTAIARGLARAVRGEPQEGLMAEQPALAGVSVELARRISNDAELTMASLALSLGESGAQSIDEVIDALEQLSLESLARRRAAREEEAS